MKYSAITLLAAITLASAPALAHRHHAHHARFESKGTIRALDERDNALQRYSMIRRIGAVERERIADQRQEIQKLKKQIMDGRKVDRYALNRALGPNDAYFTHS